MSLAAPEEDGAAAGVLARPSGAASMVGAALVGAAREAWAAQAGRLFLWTPVAFGCGAAAYMTARSEPPLLLLAGFTVTAVAAAVAARRAAALVAAILLLLACAAAGALAGGLRTAAVAAPVVEAGPPRLVEGWVIDVDSPGSAGPRLVLAPTWIEGVTPDARPARVRVGVGEGGGVFGPGASLRLRALLNPPPPPAAPGAYDFARDAFFRRIGGVGYAVQPPTVVALRPPAWPERLAIRVNAFRWSLTRRIVDRLGPETGGVAAAMVTGHEAFIPPEQTEAMRDSGLAHILSISGLHMAIVGGFVFAAVRLGAAAWPALALRVSTKKLAAAAGLVAVAAYLILSGAPPPAIRAFVTAGVAFAAMLAGRRAITLRALAFAALIVLVLQPEAVLQPGFQMSFAATAALVALAEALERPVREISVPWPIAAVQRSLGWLGLSLLISLVAGAATAPFAVQHFNRVASYGLFANLVTAPLTSFVLMPSLAVGAVGEGVGLGVPLHVAGWAVDALNDVAAWVAARPGAVVIVPSAPAVALAVSFLGVLTMTLWRGPLRWLALPAAAAVFLWPRPEPPTVWVAAGGANAAVVEGGRAHLMLPEVRLFAAELWSRRRGQALDTAAYACGRKLCAPPPGLTPAVALWRWRTAPNAREVELLCRDTDILLWRALSAPPAACHDALILTRAEMERQGAAEIHRTPTGWRVTWTEPQRGRRIWTATP